MEIAESVGKEDASKRKKLEEFILKHHQKILRIQCRKASTAVLHLAYSIMEGFTSTDMVKNGSRLVYRIMSVISLLCVHIISLLGYIITTDNVNIADLMYVLGLCASFLYCHVFMPCVTYRYRQELRTILQRIDSEFDFSQKLNWCTINARQKHSTVAEGTKWSLCSLTLWAVILSNGLVYAILFCDQNSLGNPNLFILYMPFANQIHSYTVFLFVYCSTNALTLSALLTNTSIVLFPIMIGHEFYNAYLNIAARFHTLINGTISNLSICWENDNDKQAFETKVFHMFKEELGVVVRQYLYLKKSLMLMKPFMEIYISVSLGSVFIVQVPFAYVAIFADISVMLRIKLVAILLVIFDPIYCCCYYGNLCEEMSTMMSEEVYFSRWYELPPKYRKMVHIFQCQTQESVSLRAFKLYNVTVTTFAKTLRFAYTVLNLTSSYGK